MKVSSKLVLLISLGVAMIGLQFGVNRYFDRKVSQYIRAVHELNNYSEDLLNAIVEEKNFTMNHMDQSLQEVLRYLKDAKVDAQILSSHQVVSSSDVRSLQELLDKYQHSFSHQANLIKELDLIEGSVDQAIVRLNRRADEIIDKINTYVETSGAIAEEVDENLRSLANVTRDIVFSVNKLFLTINEDLFQKNDVTDYLLHTNQAKKDLESDRKNASALLSVFVDPEYTEFIKSMIEIMDKIPHSMDKIRQTWSDKEVNQAQLDGIRLQVVKTKESMLASAGKEMEKFNNKLLLGNAMAFAVGTLVLLFIGMWIVRSITKPISKMTSSAKKIAEGDLSHTALQFVDFELSAENYGPPDQQKDEIRQLSIAFVRMAKSLQSLIGQVQKSGIQVVSSATEISASAGQLNETASEQAASVNQTLATSRSISSKSQDLSKTMNNVSVLVSETAALAQKGHISLTGLETNMQQLVTATSSIVEKLESIEEKTHGIDTIVTTITKVAAQINLLSLNAAIEAEKAGEYGLGFVVVAREIRRLADQTAVATLDIEQMVQGVKASVASGVNQVDKFVHQVENGVEEIGSISGQLATIIDRVQALTPHFAMVNEAMHSQSRGAEEISKAMGHLSEAAESTTQVIHDFKVAAEQLTEVAHELQEEVSRFRVEA